MQALKGEMMSRRGVNRASDFMRWRRRVLKINGGLNARGGEARAAVVLYQERTICTHPARRWGDARCNELGGDVYIRTRLERGQNEPEMEQMTQSFPSFLVS